MNRALSTFQEGESHVKISHFTRKGYEIEGIVHVGTNYWYELQWYLKMGIQHCIGFEPLLDAVRQYMTHYPKVVEGVKLYAFALGSTNKMAYLNVANGDGQSSSFFATTEEYKKEFPDQNVIDRDLVPVRRFDEVVVRDGVDMRLYDCLVLDVEGYELEVLKGMGEHLGSFKFINVELSGTPTYVGGPTATEVVNFLEEHGFIRDSDIEPHNDVMFIREDVKNYEN